MDIYIYTHTYIYKHTYIYGVLTQSLGMTDIEHAATYLFAKCVFVVVALIEHLSVKRLSSPGIHPDHFCGALL